MRSSAATTQAVAVAVSATSIARHFVLASAAAEVSLLVTKASGLNGATNWGLQRAACSHSAKKQWRHMEKVRAPTVVH